MSAYLARILFNFAFCELLYAIGGTVVSENTGQEQYDDEKTT